ncbi:MAG TPA: preprotein translocase subunit SecE [Bryobacteraceae bacterium]|jgi:preprotein translocase subunit SecE
MAEEQSLTQKASGWPAELKDYFDELHLEMKRVTWPPWKQVRATTIVVIVSVFAFAAYFMVVDSLVDAGIQKIFKAFSR